MKPKAHAVRRALLVAFGLATLVVVAAARQYREGARAYAAYESASAAGDTPSAIAWLRAAAESVAPGSPYPARAYAELARLSDAATAKRDLSTARAGWAAMRAAALETGGLGVVTAPWEARAEAALADLATALPPAVGASSGAATGSSPAPPRSAPSPSPSPSTASFVALAAAALLFVVGVTRLLWAGVPPVRRAPATYAVAAVGLVLYGVAVALT